MSASRSAMLAAVALSFPAVTYAQHIVYGPPPLGPPVIVFYRSAPTWAAPGSWSPATSLGAPWTPAYYGPPVVHHFRPPPAPYYHPAPLASFAPGCASPRTGGYAFSPPSAATPAAGFSRAAPSSSCPT